MEDGVAENGTFVQSIYGTGENQVHALRDVSFSVEKGEFVAIIGQSDRESPPLLHMIGGVDVPSSGHDGWMEAMYMPEQERTGYIRRRQVRLIYRFYNLIPVLNVVDNMTLPVKLDGQKVNRERLEELLDILDLRDRAAHLPRQLSGGQQQRAAIGRALYMPPPLVLADEPTGNLDSRNSQEITNLLKYSNRTYRQTLILITHDQEIALQADCLIRLEDGRIVSDAPNGRQGDGYDMERVFQEISERP